MNIADRIRAWKDPVFRASLSTPEMAQLHDNPAGMIELTGTALDLVSGGGGKSNCNTKCNTSGKSKKSNKSKKSHKSKKSGRSGGSRGSGYGC